MRRTIDIVFDGPPSPGPRGSVLGKFVEVEDADGKSISIGEWVTRPGDPVGWAALRIPDPRPDTADADPSDPAPPRYDGDTANLDRARAGLDRQSGGNPQWTGPHPDWTAHTVAVVVEAGLRDLVAAVRAVGERVGDAVDAHASELGRQRS